MGSIHPVYARRHGKVARPRRIDGYRAAWRDGEGRQRTRHFERKGDARRFLAQVEADLVRGEDIDPISGRMTLGTYVLGTRADSSDGWLVAQVWRRSTRDQAESHLRAHILPAFGERPLGQITRTEVQGFVTRLSSSLAPATVETIYRRLVSILESAVADRVIARSPAVRIKLPKRTQRPADLVGSWPGVERIRRIDLPMEVGLSWTSMGISAGCQSAPVRRSRLPRTASPTTRWA